MGKLLKDDSVNIYSDLEQQIETVSSALLHKSRLVDQFERHKRKLRISLTDRCNFKCSYCMPDHPTWLAKQDILTFEELYEFCHVMVTLGINQIRLTGGEPLMRKGVVSFIQRLNKLKSLGLERISMTTNAYYLEQYAMRLKEAGLDDLNVSLDSIHPDTFFNMTQKNLAPVLKGIYAAKEAHIPIKLNCVLVKGQNDQDILPLTNWAYQNGFELRFIEYMPLDQPEHWEREKVIIEDEIINVLSSKYAIRKLERNQNPATLYSLNHHFKVGVISTISKPFCQSCDRLRLTATGDLFTCLFANSGTSLRKLLNEPDKKKLVETILETVWHKKAGYIAYQMAPVRKITMHSIGG